MDEAHCPTVALESSEEHTAGTVSLGKLSTTDGFRLSVVVRSTRILRVAVAWPPPEGYELEENRNLNEPSSIGLAYITPFRKTM